MKHQVRAQEFLLLSMLFLALGSTLKAQVSEHTSWPSGAFEKISKIPIPPQRMKWSAEKPSSLKVMPKGVVSPLYGTIKLGQKEAQTAFLVVLDAPKGKPSRLFIDFNGNGDLTDDPKPEWKPISYLSGKMKRCWFSTGWADFPVKYGKKTQMLRLLLSRQDSVDPEINPLFLALEYKADFGIVGSFPIGEKGLPFELYDARATGDFHGSGVPNNSGIFLWLDVNGNGKVEDRGEFYDAIEPFNIGGTTYEIKDISSDGKTFALAKSAKTVKEIMLPPDLANGKKALPFEAASLDGQTVHFPGDYPGKKVLLYFWATWCGDCQRELPGVVKAYKSYHEKGLEAIGLTVERSNDSEQDVKDFVKNYGIAWAQIYNNQMWSGDLCQLYYISHTPTAYLIDCDTGKILASGLELMGDRLETTLKRELAPKPVAGK